MQKAGKRTLQWLGCAVLTGAVASSPSAGNPDAGGAFTVLHSFGASTDGQMPYSGPVMDSAGNLYGTTAQGGANHKGTVFKIDPSGRETILHSFSGADGQEPQAGLIVDSADSLYGTTATGGANNMGAVFKVDASGHETVLHSFTGGTGDGMQPAANLIMDSGRNLYGTTAFGGTNNRGTVFKIDPSGRETVLHSFAALGKGDGAYPLAGLTMDSAGDLYGVTGAGGAYLNGTVFKIDTSDHETVVYAFATGADGRIPSTAAAGLVMDNAGNLYGATIYGGANGKGTVFEIDVSGHETILHSFATPGTGDGAYPRAGLMMDRAGDLYGTTSTGDANNGGTVFKIDPSGHETILHSFDTSMGGERPSSSLTMDSAGNLYGATLFGGVNGKGTVFKIN